MPKKQSIEIINEIINLYNNGNKVTDISKKLNINNSTIFRVLKRENIKLRTKKNEFTPSTFPQKEINNITSLYESGLSANKIAKLFNLHHQFILKILRCQGIEIKPVEEQIRKYNINEHFFDYIDTEEKSYFLGLLYADGCNHLKTSQVTLFLQENDVEILKKLNSFLFEDKPLYFINKNGKGKNQYGLCIFNKYICQKLNELGCIPNKSLKLKFPIFLEDENLLRSFIRGYSDGDGSINCSIKKRKKTPTFSWSLISTQNFCMHVKDIIVKYTGTNLYLCKTNNNITYVLRSGGNLQVQKILDWLYKDASIFMDRKYNKYLELLKVNAREKYRSYQ